MSESPPHTQPTRPESPVKKAAATAGAAAAAAARLAQLAQLGPGAMHKHLLYMRPRQHEQAYYEQFESLDLVNCIIAPLFFANALSLWNWSGLSLVYCAVLLIKGYQLGLLLLPQARRQHKYRRARFYLILAERVLRQFVATPALGRSPRFNGWMRQLQATSSPPLLISKILVLISGVTISFWNAFCLPLDFVSQALVNGVFFCIHFMPITPQVATAMAMLTSQRRHLVWVQWRLEQACLALLRLLIAGRGGSAWLLQATAHVAAAAEGLPVGIAARADAGGSSSSTCAAQQLVGSHWGSTSGGGSSTSTWAAGAAAVAVRPRNAPDVDSVAGRLIMALSTAHMLLMVLIVPLYLAWRLERHLKSKFLITLLPACQQLQRPGCKAARFEQAAASDAAAAATAAAAAGGAEWGSDSGCDADASGAESTTASCCDDGSDDGSPHPSTQQQPPQPQQQPRRRRWWDVLAQQQAGVWHWVRRQKQQLLLRHRSSFVSPPVAHAFIPPAGQLLQHLAVAAAVSLVLAELFVGVCVLSPRVRGMLHQQILEVAWPEVA